MPNLQLPERASLEYLKKSAKNRLQDLRGANPQTKLATALLAVAQDHGFSSWRALKSEIEQRQIKSFAVFFEAYTQGDVEALRSLLTNDSSLVHVRKADQFGATGLHAAAGRGHVDAVRLLLEHGADPNIREAGDNTYPLHWAAARGHIETVRALLDSGGDVHGFGDVHELDVIGWATFHRAPDEDPRAVVSLLLERGARHHIFSGICVGDLDLIQQLVEQNPEALDRRMSHFEQGQTPLHLAISRQQGMHDVTLWFYTGQVDNLYQLLKSGQAEFVEDINDTFYGAREFGIRDPNGYTLYFIRPEAPR